MTTYSSWSTMPRGLIATAYSNAPLITDFTASAVPFQGDVIMLAPDSPSYGVTNLQANFSIPGEIPFKPPATPAPPASSTPPARS